MNMVTDILYQMQMLNMATLPAQPAAKPEGDRDFQTMLDTFVFCESSVSILEINASLLICIFSIRFAIRLSSIVIKL